MFFWILFKLQTSYKLLSIFSIFSTKRVHNVKQTIWKFKFICILEEITSDQEPFQTVSGRTLGFQKDFYSDMMVSNWNNLLIQKEEDKLVKKGFAEECEHIEYTFLVPQLKSKVYSITLNISISRCTSLQLNP